MSKPGSPRTSDTILSEAQHTAQCASTPKRRLHLELDLAADSIAEIGRVLANLETDIAVMDINGDETFEGISAGWGSSHTLRITLTDPDMTGDRYREELQAWSAEQRAARARA